LQQEPSNADDSGMSMPGPFCDRCREPVDEKTAVVVTTDYGRQVTRHRRCHMLDLLHRA